MRKINDLFLGLRHIISYLQTQPCNGKIDELRMLIDALEKAMNEHLQEKNEKIDFAISVLEKV